MATAAERQAEFRKRKREAGLVPVTGFVPARHVGDVTRLLQKLCEDENLELGTLRNVKTGRLVKI